MADAQSEMVEYQQSSSHNEPLEHEGGERLAGPTQPEAFQPSQPYSAFTHQQKTWIIAVASWAGWFSTASSFIYFPAIPFMASQMNVSVQRINLTVTAYLVASGVFPTITGSVADRYGRRITILLCLSLYVVMNIGLAVQRSFPALFILRMLQSATISGALLLVTFTTR